MKESVQNPLLEVYMQMQVPGWLGSTETAPRPKKAEFSEYLEIQLELFVEAMQDTASNHWDQLQWQMNGADQEEINAEMERWWDHQIRRFKRGLREEYRREAERRKNRRLRRVIRLLQVAENGRRLAETKLEQTEGALAASNEHARFIESEFRCRDCGSSSWD